MLPAGIWRQGILVEYSSIGFQASVAADVAGALVERMCMRTAPQLEKDGVSPLLVMTTPAWI